MEQECHSTNQDRGAVALTGQECRNTIRSTEVLIRSAGTLIRSTEVLIRSVGALIRSTEVLIRSAGALIRSTEVLIRDVPTHVVSFNT